MDLQKTNINTLIFSDLDGTLLDHDTYSCDPALPMLSYLKEHAIPLVIVTSKTATEVRHIQKILGLYTPAIVENGAGIVDGNLLEPLGKEYSVIRDAFKRYASRFDIKGFNDMSIEEVAHYTALPIERAKGAKVRDFCEPFIMHDAHHIDALKAAANADGLDVIRGGRFYHLITQGQDKASAIKTLQRRYEDVAQRAYTTLALGDGANDITMLQSVDVAFLIPKKDGSYLDCDIKGLFKAPYPGPTGWNAVLKEYFHVT
jgi:mannosyl-3-phosphoglycerate phosphatase